MIKKTVITLLFTVSCLIGCSQNPQHRKTVTPQRIDTPDGMIRYLNSRNLPTLKSAEHWQNPYAPGLKLTTSHYEVYTTLLEPLMLSEVPGFLESCYRGYNSQLPSPIESTTKLTVYLFANRRQWKNFTDVFNPSQAQLLQKKAFSAYYFRDACVVYNTGRAKTFTNLGHEGWHQFNKRYFKFRLPTWLDEGIAMQFEVSREDKGLFYFEPNRNVGRLGELKKVLAKDKVIGLKRLVSLNPGELAAANDTFGIGAFYAQSYALVRFLREADYGKRLGNYHQMLLGGVNGTWPLEEGGRSIASDRNIPLTTNWNRAVGLLLFKYYMGDDWEKLEQEYITYCKKIVYHIRFK